MKTIFVIDDNTNEAKHASAFAFAIKQQMEAQILVAHTITATKVDEKILAGPAMEDGESENTQLSCKVKLPDQQQNVAFTPKTNDIDISQMCESDVATIINKNHVWMIIKGVPDDTLPAHPVPHLNVQIILNKVLCPLLLVPQGWPQKKIDRLVYLADLRYCRIQVVKYLANLAKHWGADLSIVHISAKGLPDIADNYALSIFTEEICLNIDYDRLFFNNTKGGDVPKVVDVIIHAMHNDLLAVVHHRFHFEELLGTYIGETLPLNITVPLLIFPY